MAQRQGRNETVLRTQYQVLSTNCQTVIMNARQLTSLVFLLLCGCEPPAASTAAKSAPPPPPAVGVQVAEVTVSAERPPDALAPEEQPVEAPALSEPPEPASP